MTIYHVRPMDLHAPGEHCNSYDCSAVVVRSEYDALVATLRAIAGMSYPACGNHPIRLAAAALRTPDSADANPPLTPDGHCARCGGTVGLSHRCRRTRRAMML